VHRFVRLLCLAAAIAVLLFSAQVANRLAQVALKDIGTIDNTVPELTRFMVVRIADGSFPVMLIAGAVAAVVAIAGLFAILSRRLSAEAAGTMLVVVCTVALITAVLLLATMGIAISIGRGPAP
jgi:hypothetical protein